LNGAIEINTLDIDPTQGLENLPSIPLSVEISEGCQASYRNRESVRFVNQGHGGVASRPEEPLNAEMFIADWVNLNINVEGQSKSNMLYEYLTQRREEAERKKKSCQGN
jgi:hypothetical protein